MIATGTERARAAAPAVRRRLGKIVGLALGHAVAITACVLTMLPALWVLGTSFSADPSLFSFAYVPEAFGLQSYQYLFEHTLFLTWLRNSVLFAAIAAGITLAISTLAAYGFWRFRFRGRRYGVLLLLLLQLFPALLALVAYYRFLVVLGLINTVPGLILVWSGAGTAFCLWLLNGYMESIPRELDEAAQIDGAGPLASLVRVILPSAKPMLAVVFLFQFIGFYNDYIVISILMNDDKSYTASVGLRTLIIQFAQKWPAFAAGAVLASLPIVAIFFSAQRYLEEGLTRGSVRG